MDYVLIDRQTGKIIARGTDVRALRARRNRLDAAYGAVRYIVRPAREGE